MWPSSRACRCLERMKLTSPFWWNRMVMLGQMRHCVGARFWSLRNVLCWEFMRFSLATRRTTDQEVSSLPGEQRWEKTRRGGGSTWSRSTGGDEWRVSKTFSTIQRRKQGRRRSLAGRSWLIICRKARNLYISYLMMQQHEDVGHDAARAVQRPFQAICRMDGVVFHAWSGSSSSSIPLQALMWLLKTFWHPIWMRAGFISSFFTKTTLLVRGTYSKMAGKKSGCG